MLGALTDHQRMNHSSRWRHTLDALHHGCLRRKACGDLHSTVIGETSCYGEACHPIISDGVHKVAIAI
jgi:hypothetical protein